MMSKVSTKVDGRKEGRKEKSEQKTILVVLSKGPDDVKPNCQTWTAYMYSKVRTARLNPKLTS